MLKKVQESPFTYSGGPKGHALLGSLPQIKKSGPIEFFFSNALNYGDLIDFNVGKGFNVQLNHPELIEYVLVKNHKNYRKGDNYIRFSDYLGLGLLTSNGEKWKKDRQMMQPMFNRGFIEGLYSSTTSDVVKDIKKKWSVDAADGLKPVNVTKDMAYVTINVALKTLFGNDITVDEVEMIDWSMNAVMDYVGLPRIFAKHDTNRFTKRALYKKAQEGHKYMADFTRRKMRAGSNGRDNILSILQEMKYEDGSAPEEQVIIDHAITMIFAGYETTATLLQWTWYVLSKHPDAENKLREEITSNVKDIDNASYDELLKLPYLDMVFKEAARLYPSFWGSARAPIEDDVIGGFEIKAGTTLAVPIYVMQRHPKWWQNPEAFIPERFSPENEKNIVSGSYIPFSLGPRKCIGYRFAEMELKMVIAKLLPYFTTETVPGQPQKLRPIISLKKEGDLLMYIKTV